MNTEHTTHAPTTATTPPAEPPLNAQELMAMLRITHANTLRVAIKERRVPAPDIKISNRVRLWHRSTLRAAGILPADAGQAVTATTAQEAA